MRSTEILLIFNLYIGTDLFFFVDKNGIYENSETFSPLMKTFSQMFHTIECEYAREAYETRILIEERLYHQYSVYWTIQKTLARTVMLTSVGNS